MLTEAEMIELATARGERAAAIAARDTAVLAQLAAEAARDSALASVAPLQAKVDALRDDKTNLQEKVDAVKLDKAALQEEVAEWKALAEEPEDPAVAAMMRRVGALKVRLREAEAERLLAVAGRTSTETHLVAVEAELVAVVRDRDARADVADLAARVEHLAGLLDSRCDLPRGHAKSLEPLTPTEV